MARKQGIAGQVAVAHSRMSTYSYPDGQARARRACRFCTRRKIRCTRELPMCSSCKLHKRECLYHEDLRHPISEPHNHAPRAFDVEPHPSRGQGESSGVAIRFLDYDVFRRSQAPLVSPLLASAATPSYVFQFLRDHTASQGVATRYYQLINPWLPFISKRKVFDHLLNPLLPPRLDTSFLLFCMKLVMEPPQKQGHRTTEYHTAVQFLTDIQLAGIVSLEVLQGCILLAVYEQGHAIYPAAQTSIGVSLKYALTLGLGWSDTPREPRGLEVWVDREERRRTWWTIFLLERTVALGDPQQPLLTPEPDLTAQLPCNETTWYNQTSAYAVATLLSPPESLGRFASVVQASYILSRVFRHVSDSSLDPEFRLKEVDQLQKTLRALLLYAESNQGTTYSIICYQTAISFCSILTLYAPYQHDPAHPLHQQAINVADDAADLALKVAQTYLDIDMPDFKHGDIPPFVLPWMYKAGMRFVQTADVTKLSVIESVLHKLDAKWKAAGSYLELLAAVRVMGSGAI